MQKNIKVIDIVFAIKKLNLLMSFRPAFLE